ncbi:hypothetical protein [Streptomyces sp. bgisy100]|uniref:hypothetical protein n=1 Tax=Streptomyces sp. bgisy100 TaxID=3413783 RepID=UPI003D70EE68
MGTHRARVMTDRTVCREGPLAVRPGRVWSGPAVPHPLGPYLLGLYPLGPYP